MEIFFNDDGILEVGDSSPVKRHLRCPECTKRGLKSRIYIGMSTRTAMGFIQFYDEDGVYHSNDPNKTTTHYECSNGHKFQITD